ncbi:DoxX-like family protein [Mucilaginibacter gossypiicola]|uniref:DoxX-like family protein n=1 Tax=Mucilaginibacter gossypiicola TaxID=551995 RepID=A0A1H8M0T5_9SPHI|nr:DoxX family protein [Mucilaginibacter gossypiicola]SEO10985.1 DoxX-like family protein [Mucilaginibacter gossypiicola]
MKQKKLIYWATTGLVVAGMLLSVVNYFFNPELKVAYAHIGFPDWFRIELGIAKLCGALALAIPVVRPLIKEWAYFGFFVNFSSAILAHYMVHDPLFNLAAPFIMLVLVIISYISYHSINKHEIK